MDLLPDFASPVAADYLSRDRRCPEGSARVFEAASENAKSRAKPQTSRELKIFANVPTFRSSCGLAISHVPKPSEQIAET